MKWLRRIGIALVALLIIALVAKHFLLDVAPIPAQSAFVLDLDGMRAAAQGQGGALPVRLESLVVGSVTGPKVLAVAGGGFGDNTMVFTAFRLVYPDRSIVIDTAMDRETADRMFPGNQFSDEAYKTLQEAMRGASQVIITHEHPDHIGGLPRSPYLAELKPKVLLTPEQIHGPSVEEVRFAPGVLESFTPLQYQGLHVLAPGVVLAKAGGHSPGTQLIFVRLEGGAEFLFVGDIVWHMDGIETLTGKPWVASKMVEEDREAVASQVRAFHDAVRVKKDPVNILVAHDQKQLEGYIARGLITDGFR